jgi:monoamine oxidase
VLVVGAGAAGLTAARALRGCGFGVTVIEGRDRIGGRLHTLRRDSLPAVDLGASWIHGGQGNPLAGELRQAGLRHVVTDLDAIGAWTRTGQRVPDGELERAYRRIERWTSSTEAAAEDWEQDASWADALRRSPPAGGATALERWIARSEIGVEYACDLDELSVWWGMDDGEWDGDEWMIREGYGALAEHWATDLRRADALVTGAPVRAIRWGGGEAVVESEAGTWRGDAVVCTLPLGVLQAGDVTFDPPLPPAHQTALQGLRAGTLNKCFLHFDRAFWPADLTLLGFVEESERVRFGEFFQLSGVAGSPLLMAFNAGAEARRLEDASDEEHARQAMERLRATWPGAPDPVAVTVTRWASDPFARGAYSFVPPGSHSRHFTTLGEPCGERLVLAGEACDREFRGTVHGAYFSGLRAAALLADRFG